MCYVGSLPCIQAAEAKNDGATGQTRRASTINAAAAAGSIGDQKHANSDHSFKSKGESLVP